jgi:hypothetical protein
MKIVRISCVLMVILLLTTPYHVMASDFWCGSKIITIRDHKFDVLRKCGDPSHAEVWEEVHTTRDFGPMLSETEMGLYRLPLIVGERVTIEEWEYNLGPTKFIRYLRFENGRLIRITDGNYGY